MPDPTLHEFLRIVLLHLDGKSLTILLFTRFDNLGLSSLYQIEGGFVRERYFQQRQGQANSGEVAEGVGGRSTQKLVPRLQKRI